MIVLDTSALIAILQSEPEAAAFARSLSDADRAVVGAPTRFEMLLVAANLRGPGGEAKADALLTSFRVEVLDWTMRLSDIAIEAHLRFGRGRHPARLNFGDCIAYALAKSLDAPLLFKGTDFVLTDVRRVPA